MPTTRRWLICGAALAGVNGLGSRQAAAEAAASETVSIGALFPLSGPLAPLGDECFRGLDLAADARNDAGGLLGKPIRLVKADVTDPGRAAEVVRHLVGDAHVTAIFGSGESAVSLAATPASELAGVPYFELNAISDAVTSRGLTSVFRFGAPTTAFAAVSVQSVADVLAPLWRVDARSIHIAILHDDGTSAASLAALQERICHEAGLSVDEVVSYQAGSLDLVPIAARLRAIEVDLVLHAGDSDDGVLFMQALRQVGWKPRMLIGCGAGYWLGAALRSSGGELEGMMTIDVPPYRVATQIAPGAAALADTYQKKYGARPRSGQSLTSYSGAQVFFDAIARAGSLDPAKVRAAVLATEIPQDGTACGWGAHFDETGQNVRSHPFLLQWQNGEQVTVYPSAAAVASPEPSLGT